MKKILIVANVAKEHILKFHVPLIHMLKESGWTVHVACAGEEEIPYCDQQWHMVYERNPVRFATLRGIVQLRRILKRENTIWYIATRPPAGWLPGWQPWG